jgi:two-component system response regulator AtoC
MTHAILVIEDEAVFAKNVQTYLMREGYEVRITDNVDAALREFDAFRPGIVLLDYNLTGVNGLEILAQLKQRDPKVPVVVLTGHGSVEIAVQAMKLGAADYLSKPMALSELKLVIDRVLKRDQISSALAYYQKRDATGVDLESWIGDSRPMRELKATVTQIINSERSLTDDDPPAVLITGETGTGKELIARAVHFSGARADKPFVEINCASIPSNLLEAELFGYERGAFTDAKERKQGLVETAEGGTLFLDEIGEVAPAVQVKLLKLLEEKRVRRLGGVREQQVNVRIVTATNRDLSSMVREGSFRADLYYRLRIVHVNAPPLRERGDDVLLLARHFLAVQGERYGRPGISLDAEAERMVHAHAWSGNVRELRNAIEQAVLLAKGATIGAAQFPFCKASAVPTPAAEVVCGTTVVTSPAASPDSDIEWGAMERDLVEKALLTTGWNVTRAARLLGVSRDTLRYRIEKHQIQNTIH